MILMLIKAIASHVAMTRAAMHQVHSTWHTWIHVICWEEASVRACVGQQTQMTAAGCRECLKMELTRLMSWSADKWCK